jgi:hypothetical protein
MTAIAYDVGEQSWIGLATVRSVGPGGLALVETGDGRFAQAVPTGAHAVGARVLVALGAEGAWVLRELGPTEPKDPRPVVESPSGARAAVEGEALVVRDAAGRVLFEHGPSGAAVHVQRDLALAVDGKLRLEASDGVELACGEERLALAPKQTALSSARLSVTAGDASLQAARASVVAAALETVAESARGTFGRLEVKAARIVERAHETYREATEAAHSRAGRMRVIADGAYQLFAGRARLRADEELALDGEQIRLG